MTPSLHRDTAGEPPLIWCSRCGVLWVQTVPIMVWKDGEGMVSNERPMFTRGCKHRSGEPVIGTAAERAERFPA